MVYILTVLDSPETVLGVMPLTNKVAGIVYLIMIYKGTIGFGLLSTASMTWKGISMGFGMTWEIVTQTHRECRPLIISSP